MAVGEVSFFELELLVGVAEFRSVRALARGRGLKPSHVSKTLARLEEKLGQKLFVRSPAGLVLGSAGVAVLATARRLLSDAESLEAGRRSPGAVAPKQQLSVGAVSFINKFLLAPLCSETQGEGRTYSLRLLDVPPDMLLPSGMRGALDLAVHIGEVGWPRTWQSQRVGEMAWRLFARRGHPLGMQTGLHEALAFPFIVPTYWRGEDFVAGDDHFPQPWKRRLKGHEVSTAEIALEVVRVTDELAFVPELVARTQVALDQLQPIDVLGVKPVSKPVFLSVKADVMPAAVQRRLVDLLKRILTV